jgi:hypothetical protein
VAIGLNRRRERSVSLEQGATSDAPRCPACGEPLFAWVETLGYGPTEDQVIDRCENCGLVVARDAVPAADPAAAELVSRGQPLGGNAIAVRIQNPASLEAWLGAENWAALRPGGHDLKPTRRAAGMLLARRAFRLRRSRPVTAAGIASMWQTLLNLLTFHRDFASETVSGRLRPGTGRGAAAFWVDAAVTILAAIPTAILAVLLEGGAVLARRGSVLDLEAEPMPDLS